MVLLMKIYRLFLTTVNKEESKILKTICKFQNFLRHGRIPLGVLFFSGVMLLHGQENENFILNGTVMVKYIGEAEHVIIPQNLGITEIGEKAFAPIFGLHNENLKSVVMPEGVTVIGDEAFYGCVNLENITIPEGVISIGDRAFFNCENLTNITIPTSVTAIGRSAFFGSGLISITIPPSVSVIEEFTFASCWNLKDVIVSEGVVSIGDRAFWNSGLSTVTIPRSVISIGNEAFHWVGLFTLHGGSASIIYFRPGSLISIEVDDENIVYSSSNGVLFNKDKTLLILYPANKNEENFIIPEGVTAIEDRAFYGCYNLTSITIPSSVVSIGTNAFYSCKNLKTIVISRNARIDRKNLPRNVEIVMTDK